MHQSALIVQKPAEAAAQLILLFHGVGSEARSLVPLGQRLAAAFPQAMVVSVTAPHPSDISPNGFQWFSVAGITEENRVDRVAAALPSFEACVTYWQAQAGVGAAATALVGFSQGAIMALASSVRPDPVAARIIAIGGRFAKLPHSPLHEGTSIHLLHGKADAVISYSHAVHAAHRLKDLGTDFTADVLPFIGHEVHPDLADMAIEKLKSHIPARLWLKPGEENK
jgi:phospholipase/carboxylesterase